MFGDEQEYFEERKAEPMNEAFYEEHFDSSASVYGVNEDLSDEKKEAKHLKKYKKSKFTAKNYLYPLTSVGFYTTLIIVEISIFIAFLSQAYTLSSTPLYKDSDMLFVVAAIAAVIVYVVFIFLSVPILKAKEEVRNKIKSVFDLSTPQPYSKADTQNTAYNSSQNTADKNAQIKSFIKKNAAWVIPVGLVFMFATGGGALIFFAIVFGLFKNLDKINTTNHDKSKRK